MKFLIIAQDLRISGTSEGIVSRSFISKLKKVFPSSVIDVHYLKHHRNEDQLELLPIDSVRQYYIKNRIPFSVKLFNWGYWRVFGQSLNEIYIIKKYKKIIKGIDYHTYDHIFIRSSGIQHETILAASGLPILKKSIINFHDTFPQFWDTGSAKSLNTLELLRLKKMNKVVSEAKLCITPSKLLSRDLSFLYGSYKNFYTLPHQFDPTVCKIERGENHRRKEKRISISYHGAVEYARKIEILLDVYLELVKEDKMYKNNTEFVLRIKGSKAREITEKYGNEDNIRILQTLNFSNSAYEQLKEADITIVLENCITHSNILVGKSPYLAFLRKPVLCISPYRSELNKIITEKKYIAHCDNFQEVKSKLKALIISSMNNEKLELPFNNYFGEEKFEYDLKQILAIKEN